MFQCKGFPQERKVVYWTYTFSSRSMKHVAWCGAMLTVCLLASVPVYAVSGGPFADVDEGDPLAEPLAYLREKGAIEGYGDGTFHPERSINRAEALKMLYRATGESIPPLTSGSPFADVPAEAWYSHVVAFAQVRGVVKGYPDGTFRPGNTINRAEALKILLHILGESTASVTAESLQGFGSGEVPWYASFVVRATDLALTDSPSADQFPVGGDMTRGELANMLYRLLYLRERGLTSFPLYEEGTVSYYAEELAGRPTSSGEPYTPGYFSAAHPSAPFGSFVQVMDTSSGKSVLVRVNDRGPHTKGRIVDLSRVAFTTLHPVTTGVFSGTLFPLPQITSKEPKRTYGAPLLGILDTARPLPNMVWQGELYALEVTGDVQKLPALTLRGPDGQQETITAHSASSGAVYPVFFAHEGAYTLSSAATPGTSLTITARPRFSGKTPGETAAPTATFSLGTGTMPILTWTAPLRGYVLRLILTQGEIREERFLNPGAVRQVTLDSQVLGRIDPSRSFTLSLSAAQSATSFSHDISTSWRQVADLVAPGTPGTLAPTPVAPTPPTPTPAPASEAGYTSDQWETLRRVNQERAKQGVAPLVMDEVLTNMAQFKAEDMATRSYFAHRDPEGRDVNDWKGDFAYRPVVAENIAYSTEGVTDNINNLIKSPGHYANMVDPRYEVLGVGIAAAGGKTYMTQHFSARPISDGDLRSVAADFVSAVTAAGLHPTHDVALSQVAQEWAAAISQEQVMSFSMNGRDVGAVLRERIGNYSFSMAVYGDVSATSLRTNLLDKLGATSKVQKYGLGLAMDAEGMVRMTLVMQKE